MRPAQAVSGNEPTASSPTDPVTGMPSTEMEPAVREQLLELMLDELGEKGRKGISLPDVLARADVSEADFAAEFDDLDACLDVAYDQLTARIERAVRLGCAGAWPPGADPGWPDRVRAGLEALLAELTDDPLRARTLIRAYPSLGNRAQVRYQSFVNRFGPLLTGGREFSGAADQLPASVEMLAVGAAEAIVFEEVASGRAEGLPKLLPSILFSVLVPFLGPAAAAAEMEKAQH
jgi:AcrR family transcriptional regulator